MKGYGSCMSPIDAGVVMDIEELLLKFKERNSLKLADFMALYKETEFYLIYAGRTTDIELIEFSETLLQTAAIYMASHRGVIKSKDFHDIARGGRQTTLEERIFGVYLIYALYYSQPKRWIMRIRMSTALVEDVLEFIQYLKKDADLQEPFFCLKQLFTTNAFMFVPFERLFDPATHKRHDLLDLTKEHYEDIDSPLQSVTAIADSVNLDIIKELEKLYHQGKANLGLGERIKDIKEPVEVLIKRALGEYMSIYESRSGEYLRTPFDNSNQTDHPQVPTIHSDQDQEITNQ